MLIVSKFHDYYDTATAYGIDKTCVYKREEKEIKLSKALKDERWPYVEEFTSRENAKYEVHKLIIGFCGEIYPVVVVTKTPYLGIAERFCFYEPGLLRQFFIDEGMDLINDRYKYYRWYFSPRDFTVKNDKSMESFFDEKQWKGFLDQFHLNKCPVFVFGIPLDKKHYTKLVLNPTLKTFRFAIVKDPVSAFQDIYMYISGVLGSPEKEPLPISDKIKAANHGHDGEYSFKNVPGKKRGRNK